MSVYSFYFSVSVFIKSQLVNQSVALEANRLFALSQHSGRLANTGQRRRGLPTEADSRWEAICPDPLGREQSSKRDRLGARVMDPDRLHVLTFCPH